MGYVPSKDRPGLPKHRPCGEQDRESGKEVAGEFKPRAV